MFRSLLFGLASLAAAIALFLLDPNAFVVDEFE